VVISKRRRAYSILASAGRDLREEWVCHGRAEVVDTFRWGLGRHREIDALEFTRGGEQVVLGARGPRIDAVEDEPLEGQIFNVFTMWAAARVASPAGGVAAANWRTIQR
jgi:hypothetical protein